MSIVCIFYIVAPMRLERIRNFLQLILSQSCLPIPTRSHLLGICENLWSLRDSNSRPTH